MTIELYTWSTPNGRKVSIALEEMNLEYEVHAINISRDEQFNPSFLDISPNNKIPAIRDLENGRAIMESGAILLYLADKTDRFQGSDRWQTLEWLMLQMGGVGPMFGQAHHFLRFNKGQSGYAEDRYRTETHRLYKVLNERVKDREYLATDYSIADMATWPWVARWEWHEMEWRNYPYLKDWYIRIAQRPAVQRGYAVPSDTGRIPLPT